MKTHEVCDNCESVRAVDSLRYDGSKDRLICVKREACQERAEALRIKRQEANAFRRAEQSGAADRDRVKV